MIDVIICWPRDIYYPLFVLQMNRDRDLFEKVIIVMTAGESNRDFTGNIAIKDATVLQIGSASGDWRDIATKAALSQSKSDYVLFLEQDFFYKKGLIEKIMKSDADMVGFRDGNRFHPACLLIKKSALSDITLDFSANPPKHDHFGGLTKQLDGKTFEELGIDGWYHLSGLTHNFRLPEAFHKRDEFCTYCELCKELPQPEDWKRFSKMANRFSYVYNEEVASYFDEYIS